jgi:plastocyanin
MRVGRFPAVTASFLLAACGGSSNPVDTGSKLIIALASPSGDGQTGTPGEPLGQPFRVIMANGSARPEAGRTVTWAVTSGGGSLSVATATTDANGIATTRLTLGPTTGLNRITASSPGANGSPRTFTATGVIPGEFVQVDVTNNQFSPSAATIAAGGSVLFRWPEGSRQHNIIPVAPQTRPSATTVVDGPTTHEETFPTSGTYNYFCSVHGSANSGMRGTVIVQ